MSRQYYKERRFTMNELLPTRLCDLEPISGNRNTFGETVFVNPYSMLRFREKLKVACDLVRQTMLVCNIPNPKNDVEKLTGDSYTACCALVEYLKMNNLGHDQVVCFARKSPYEADSTSTTHFIVLASDENGEQFQIDPSPYVGYKCGKVEPINEKWYCEYVNVQGELKSALEIIRTDIYEIFSSDKIAYNLVTAKVNYARRAVEKFPILRGYLLFIRRISNSQSTFEEEENIENENLKIALKRLAEDICELTKMQSSKENLEAQLELMQTISSEKIKYGLEYEKMVYIDNEKFRMSELTPRFFYERKLNLAMLKSSAFFIGKENQFKTMLAGRHYVTGGYMVNLGESNNYGFSKMEVFHPDGYKYIREMNGPNYVFLINDKAGEILHRKRKIRKEYSFNYEGRNFVWYDGRNIEWRPIAMNLVHSSDNSVETCCNYQCAYPNRQLMTRFMYPNLKLLY